MSSDVPAPHFARIGKYPWERLILLGDSFIVERPHTPHAEMNLKSLISKKEKVYGLKYEMRLVDEGYLITLVKRGNLTEFHYRERARING